MRYSCPKKYSFVGRSINPWLRCVYNNNWGANQHTMNDESSKKWLLDLLNYPSINLAMPKAQLAAMAPMIITRMAPASGDVPVNLLLK